MPQTAPPADRALAESLLAFWADAGVDSLFLDAPVDRIAAGLAPPPRRAEPPPPTALRAPPAPGA
ncbi:MAG: hypothetical protein ACK4TR_08525, partial [Phenylobacterium sp.]